MDVAGRQVERSMEFSHVDRTNLVGRDPTAARTSPASDAAHAPRIYSEIIRQNFALTSTECYVVHEKSAAHFVC
jgi:hypothetical protein